MFFLVFTRSIIDFGIWVPWTATVFFTSILRRFKTSALHSTIINSGLDSTSGPAGSFSGPQEIISPNFISVSIFSSISLGSNEFWSHSFRSSAALSIILFRFVSRTSRISIRMISASQGPTLDTDSTVAANSAVSFRVRLLGILITPSETPSLDSLSTSIRPILPDFWRSRKSRSKRRPSV